LQKAEDIIKAQGGTMSIAQMMAMDGFLRDLNRQGYVWIDNKWNNFSFVPVNDGSGRVQVVIFDPGGIFPVKPNAATKQSAAEVAREIQLRVNGVFERQHPDYAWCRRKDFRTEIRRDIVKREYEDAFDYEEMGIPVGKEHIHFNPRSGEDFDYMVELFSVEEQPVRSIP
jgi:hypothetical protein